MPSDSESDFERPSKPSIDAALPPAKRQVVVSDSEDEGPARRSSPRSVKPSPRTAVKAQRPVESSSPASGESSPSSSEEEEKTEEHDSSEVVNENDPDSKKPVTSKISPPVVSSGAVINDTSDIKLPAGPAGTIGQYLIDQNRPFSSAQIVQKFKDKLTKAAIDKAIAQLVSKEIVIKDSNLIHVNQALLPGDDDAKSLERQIQIDTESAAQLEYALAELNKQVGDLSEQPSEADLDKRLAAELKLVEQLKERVKECDEAASGDPVAVAAKLEDLRKQHSFYKLAWKRNKQRVDEFVGMLAENRGLKKSALNELRDKMGIESDPAVVAAAE